MMSSASEDNHLLSGPQKCASVVDALPLGKLAMIFSMMSSAANMMMACEGDFASEGGALFVECLLAMLIVSPKIACAILDKPISREDCHRNESARGLSSVIFH